MQCRLACRRRFFVPQNDKSYKIVTSFYSFVILNGVKNLLKEVSEYAMSMSMSQKILRSSE